MPVRYEKIRDSLEAQGKPVKTAKRIAAATFNKTRKPGEAPVTGRAEPLGEALSPGKRR